MFMFQFAALQGNLISICLEQLNDPHHLLRQWLALCLAKVCYFLYELHLAYSNSRNLASLAKHGCLSITI